MEPLHQLSSPDLQTLASSLRSGRLTVPCTEMALKRLDVTDSAALKTGLNMLHGEGSNAMAIAMIAEAIVEARRGKQSTNNSVEVVWTGPEAPGIANRATDVVVRELFSSAETEVIVAGYAVHRGRGLFQSLVTRMNEVPSLKVRFFLDIRREMHDTTSKSELIWKFRTHFRERDWPGEKLPEIFYDPRSLGEDFLKRSVMHAKCVVVDRKSALVTSANFTEAAQSRNIELGLMVHSREIASQIASHFMLLADSGELEPLPGS